MMTRVVNKLETSLADDARVILYDNHMFRAQATNFSMVPRYVLHTKLTRLLITQQLLNLEKIKHIFGNSEFLKSFD